MLLKVLELKNFRLHKNSRISFSDKLNYIVGGNGQGKTSALEAIYYLCTTKNLNQAADSEAVNFDERMFEIKGLFSELTENKVRFFYTLDNGKKNYFLDEKQVHRASAIIGKFPVVTLTQTDHAITAGSPSERRKMVDSIISQASAAYLKILLDYNKTLKQRSALLSQIRETRNFSLLPELDAWNDSLIHNGVEIIKHRIEFAREFSSYVAKAYLRIMGEKETPSIDYRHLAAENEENIKDEFYKKISEAREDELRRATNLIGPHRDDFIFKINEMELRKFGSQGQHKTFQIALRFGQFFYLQDTLSRTPVFLLDDVFGELDSFRAGKISEFLTEVGQAFITMTDFSRLERLQKNDSDKIIEVNNGTIAYA